MAHVKTEPGTPAMQKCIRDCIDCQEICSRTLTHCLKKGGKHAEPAHVRLLMDCVRLCETSVDYMLRSSQFAGGICGVCADVCRACAKSCRGMADDAQMQKCADVCDSCAESCDKMS